MTITPITSFAHAADLKRLPTVAIDIGFSQKNRSTGYHDGHDPPRPLRFDQAVTDTVEHFHNCRAGVLILEAPLSGFFNKGRNPVARGDFETDHSSRGWYYGAGASTCLAASHFLHRLTGELSGRNVRIHLLEGFVSRENSVAHECVAKALHQAFRRPKKAEWPTFACHGETISLLSLLGLGNDAGLPAVIMPKSVS